MSNPNKTFRCGSITAAIWTENKVINNEMVEFHSIRIDKAYKDDEGQWQHTQSLSAEDLPKVALLANEVYRELRLNRIV